MAKTKRKKCSLDEISDANKEILFDILEKNGVEVVSVSFDGGGDDGQIEENDLPSNVAKIVVAGSKISAGTSWSNGASSKNWKTDCTISDIVDSLCYEALEILHGGWENNDGAYGEFVFDVKERTIRLDFNERYTESKLFEHEF